eukprot:GAFH01001744.1.p2 GENE.GAFH01001744.1~~GAFH01001744.1.p2  ORF type:complete len:260 (-),score=28.81 GAFH01001744.1:677-1435(-)
MEEVLSLESSPDYLCVGSSSSANVFSLASLDPSAPGPHSVTLHTESEVIASAFLAESKQSNNAVVAATAHLDGKIRIFRTPFISTDGSPIEAEAHSTIAAHDGSVNSISTSATDGNLLASVGEDCALNVWDLQRGDHVANLQLPEGGLMVRWLPDGLLVADRSGSISLFDVRLRSQRPVSCIATGEPLADCDWSPLDEHRGGGGRGHPVAHLVVAAAWQAARLRARTLTGLPCLPLVEGARWGLCYRLGVRG